jgi:hypothetical protein
LPQAYRFLKQALEEDQGLADVKGFFSLVLGFSRGSSRGLVNFLAILFSVSF